MKIVHSWLNDLVPVGDDVPAIADAITHLGLAVEDVSTVGSTVAGVITAKVLRTERHPDAAKVHRVFVDAGDGVERHVWCGAFNMQPGDVILSVNGRPVGDLNQDRLELENVLAQGSARIEVQRGTRRFFVTASLP